MENLFSNQSYSSNVTDVNVSSVLTMAPALSKSFNMVVFLSVFSTMVTVGCSMDLSKLKHHIVNPKGVLIAVVAQFGLMPLTAFCFTKAFQLREMKALVVLICGCCPGGNYSNIIVLALQGEVNLSVIMTTCSTVLALGMMPLLLYIYTQGMELVQSVPYLSITISLLMILIPCGGGVLITHYLPQYSKTIIKAGLILSGIMTVMSLTLGFIGIGKTTLILVTPSILAITSLMPFTGYSTGYVISFLFRLNPAERRTVAIETGFQNVTLCVGLLQVAFPEEVFSPRLLFPAFYIVFQLVEALLLIVLFRCYQRFTLKQRESYQPTNTEDVLREDC